MRYWVLTGFLVAAYLLQTVVSSYLTIAGVTPDFLLVTVVTYGLLFGWRTGLMAGIMGGLLMDLTAGRFIGLHVLSLGAVGWTAGLVEEKVFKDNVALAPTGALIGSLIAQSIVLCVLWLFGWHVSFISTLRYTMLPAALYDMCLIIPVYGRIYRYYHLFRPDTRGTIVIRR